MGNKHDLIVVGTGWHGLAAAKTYIELHPAEDILILEAEGSCGGTWSAERLYPGLKSNNLLDTYEFPDLPMSPDVYGVQPGSHIPGPVLHRYLTDFAKKFGVFSRTRFNTKVVSVEPSSDGGWVVQTSSTKDASKTATLETRKIILATGLTSQPNFPAYASADTFGAPHFHAKDFCRHGKTVETAERVVIVGGGKSAFDVAYAYVDHGAHVDLVIRKAGNGPAWIAPPWVMGGKKRLEQLLSVRWMTWFSPCPWGGIDGFGWVRSLLHGTAVGRFIVGKFWEGLGGEVLEVNGYAKHAELKKLQPWNSAFWTGSGLSILNYDKPFFDMVRTGKINVHIADVARLSPNTVHLDDGTALPSIDALICATGWAKDPSIDFTKFGPNGLGLPHPGPERERLAADADAEILTLYPSLRAQPKLNYAPKPGEPFRMYRFIVPPGRLADRNIAFAGLVSSVSTAPAANVQALWISAYLDGRLDRGPGEDEAVTKEILLHTQWGKWRFPCGYGASLPDMVFEVLPYMGLLLEDLGLKVNRKPSLWKEITEPYSPRDFVGLVDEWVDVHGVKA